MTKIDKLFMPALWILLALIFGLAVYCNTPSKGQPKTDCTHYASVLSSYEITTGATGDTKESQKRYTDEKKRMEKFVECSDLHAQWAMADVTWWAFGAGVAGIALVLMTLRSAGRANQIARDANKAFIEVIGSEIVRKKYGSSIEIAVRNNGNSSATDLMFSGTMTMNFGSDDNGIAEIPPKVIELKTALITVSPKTINVAVAAVYILWSEIEKAVPEVSRYLDAGQTEEHIPAGIIVEGAITYTSIGDRVTQPVRLYKDRKIGTPNTYILFGTGIHHKAEYYKKRIEKA